MSQEVRELAYSPILWAVTITAISLVLILATFYLVKAVKVSKEMGITQKQLKDAAKTSAIASIGPTIVICVGMISLLVMVGAPTAWMRLSVIGDITQELMAVGFSTDAYGLTATAESITPEILQIAVFLMAIACIGYLTIPVFLAGKIEVFVKKPGSKGGAGTTGIIAIAAVIGCYAYVDAPYLIALNAGTVAMIVGFLAMLILQSIQVKFKQEWLNAWGMIIAMFVGMGAGAVVA